MADSKDLKTPQQPPSKPTAEVPLDYRLLSEAVIELNISRKNVGIYPPGHIQITRSIDRAYDILQRLFEIRPEMTLGVAKDTLLVGHDYLDQKNPVYRDFALSMNQQGIAAVTFVRGLDKDELIRFHRILTTKPEDIKIMGGIGKIMSETRIDHIVIQAIDYDAFHFTEEKEMSGTPARTKEKESAGLWQDFISNLSAGTLAKPGQEPGVSLKEMEKVDPLELARLLNEQKLNPGMAIQSYDRIISTYVRGVAEKKELTREQSETLRSLNSLLKNLHPELRKQFLSVAFQRTADASPAATEEVLGGLTDDMVIDMLQQANAEGREISPTLTGLLQKLSSVSGGARPEELQARAAAAPSAPSGHQPPAATPEQMKKLFDRESYENYVSADYAATLRNLTEQPLPAAGIEAFPLNEYLDSLKDEKLDFQIGRVLLAFVDENIEEDDYGEFLKKIVAVIPDLLKTGNFALLHDVLETLRMHKREKTVPSIRSMADISLRVFDDTQFISQVVDAFAVCEKSKVRAASGFLLALGPKTIPQLFDLYALDDSPGGKRPVFDLLCRFGNAAAKEAVKRFKDPRPYYVKNLVMLVRWGWDDSVCPHLRPLLRHKDQKVRLETVTALLRFKDPAAVPALREAIRSEDPDESSQAVRLAGQFRAAEVVDTLLGKLKKVFLFELDYQVNEEIIWALGEIGSPQALPELEKLSRAALTLHPSALARMKAAIFESLERYPRASIAGLLAIGERSSDERIKRACKKLRARK